jgi:hypothetical protein
LLCIFSSSDQIDGDQSSGTKNEITAGHSRLAIFSTPARVRASHTLFLLKLHWVDFMKLVRVERICRSPIVDEL